MPDIPYTPSEEVLMRHEPADEDGYISEYQRRCPRCREIRALGMFKPYPRVHGPTPPEAVVSQFTIVKHCLICRDEIKARNVQLAQSRSLIAAAGRAEEKVKMIDMLKEAVYDNRKKMALRDITPSMTSVLNAAAERGFGGIDGIADDIGLGLKKDMGLESSPKIRQMAIRTAIGFIRDANKLKQESVDLSELTDDELVRFLMPSARQMALESAEFRQQMLNDPDVRVALLGELGVEVLQEGSA